MELKSVFEIVKADRYSQEGCDKINAEATEDKKYNTGDISHATGLQKQPDGSWAPPKKVEQQHGKSTTSSTEIKAGTPVKVKVNGGREGIVKSVNGDIVTVEMPARGTSPARIDQYYKSDLEATESLNPDPQLAKEIANSNHFEEQKEAAKKAAKEEELRRQRAEGEANAEAYRKRYEAEHPAANSTSETKPKREAVSSRRMQKDLDGNFWSRPEDFKEDITSRGWDVEEMNNEYAVISNEAGSQYEVRFDDHSDDGDLTVRTFKPLMIDEDDDDGPEDAAPKLTGDTKIKVRK